MHNTSRLVLPLLAIALLGGCAGGSATRIVGDTADAAGGALLGHKLGKGNSLYTAVGGRVVVQLWINARWHAAILKSGATLQDSADEAFALLMAKRRGKSR